MVAGLGSHIFLLRVILVKLEERRLIYENEDIIVCHNIAKFSNGSSEVVLKSHLKKDGLLWRSETFSMQLPLKK